MTHIEAIRRKLGKNQTDFAAMAGVNQSTVSRWERGEGEPSLSELCAIVSASGGKIGPNDILSTERAA
jgi:DNA-binding transcriptional regulator YiaG